MKRKKDLLFQKTLKKVYFITRHINIFPRGRKSVRGKRVDGQQDVKNQN